MRKRISFTTLIVATLGLTAGPAAASTSTSESGLVITAYTYDPGQPVTTEVSLRCEPAGGTHPDAEGACATLEQVDGDFDELIPLGLFCPEYFQPVAVEVVGKWRDRTVTFEHVYGNRCFAQDQSEGVFQLWRPAQ